MLWRALEAHQREETPKDRSNSNPTGKVGTGVAAAAGAGVTLSLAVEESPRLRTVGSRHRERIRSAVGKSCDGARRTSTVLCDASGVCRHCVFGNGGPAVARRRRKRHRGLTITHCDPSNRGRSGGCSPPLSAERQARNSQN